MENLHASVVAGPGAGGAFVTPECDPCSWNKRKGDAIGTIGSCIYFMSSCTSFLGASKHHSLVVRADGQVVTNFGFRSC
jgi:hypothetical protein